MSRLERWVNISWEGGMVCWFVDSCAGNTHRNSSNRVLLKIMCGMAYLVCHSVSELKDPFS